MTNISNVIQNTSFSIRVSYSDYCYASDSANFTDALNTNNYQITGPGNIFIQGINSVSGDPKSFDITFGGDLGIGNQWNLNVNNISDIYGNIVNDNSTFISVEFVSQPIIGGATNETAEDVLRKFINPKLAGKVWNALIAALATGEQANWDNAAASFEQLYFSSASGSYLQQRGSDYGVDIPKNVGLTDELYRQYINCIVNKQLTLQSINELISIFYGSDAVQASVVSGLSEAYSLNDLDNLIISLNGEDPITIVFESEDFDDIGAATALEVCNAINTYFDYFDNSAYAVPYKDPQTNNTYVKIISSFLGTKSSVQINGGSAQNTLQFGIFINPYVTNVLPTWTITSNSSTNTVRFQSTTSGSIDLNQIYIGNYVNIYGNEFNSNNHGTFTVTNVSVTYPLTQYFEIQNVNGVSETVTQVSSASIMFFDSYRGSIYSISPIISAFAVQTNQEQIDVVLPVTSNSIDRSQYTAAYLNDYPNFSISSGGRGFSLLNNTNDIISLTSSSSFTSQTVTSQINGVNPSFAQPSTVTQSGQNIDLSSTTIFSNLINNPVTGLMIKGVTLSNSTSIFTSSDNFVSSFYINGSAYIWNHQTLPASISNYAFSTVLSKTASFLTGGLIAGSETANTYFIYPNCTNLKRASLNQARQLHGQCELVNGKVLVCGGTNNTTILNSVELYDPVTNAWTTVAPMNLSRSSPTVVALKNGKVLVFDDTSSPNASCELYDPTANTWVFVGNKNYIEYFGNTQSRTVLLNDGRVMIVGAYGYIPGYTQLLNNNYVTQIFDPNTNTWTAGNPFNGFLSNDGTGLSIANLTANVVYNPSLNFERVVLFCNSVVTYVQYLDIPRAEELTNYPLNNIDYRWKKSSAYHNHYGLGTVSVDGNKILFLGNDGPTSCYLYVVNSDQWGVSKLNDKQHRCVVSGNSITIPSNEIRIPSTFDTTNSTIKPNTAVDTGVIGPYIWDPENGYQIGAQSSTLTMNLYKGQSYSQISVSSTAGFPASGYLVFNFGFDSNFESKNNLVFSLKYSNILSSTLFQTDTSFQFPETVTSGSTATLVISKQPLDPENANKLGSFYLTDSPAGRIATQNGINRIAAGGVVLNYNIKYPNDTGFGGAGFPTKGAGKLSEIVEIYDSPEDDNDA